MLVVLEEGTTAGVAAVGRVLYGYLGSGIGGGAEDGAHAPHECVGGVKLLAVCGGAIEAASDLASAVVRKCAMYTYDRC